MPYFVKGFDLTGSVRLRRDTPEGALKKALELIEARYWDVQIENPQGYVYFPDQFAAFVEATTLRKVS